MSKLKFLLPAIAMIAFGFQLKAQYVQASKEEIIALTPDWKGDRFPDGRPKVSDDILRRMKPVTIEEAWAIINGAGYRYQIAEGWGQIINPDSVLVGRAYTTTFMPGRPDVWKSIDSMGKKEGRLSQNVWAVEQLQKGDVYVADQFGAKKNGPTIGDRVGTAIYTKTGNGIVYNGALRDVEGLKEFGGFTSFFSSYDPSYHNPGGGQGRDLTTMIVGINKPTNIKGVTVMPGDVVLGKLGVVIFIPPHLAERVVKSSELVR
jgi:regulator of RNase E activity RraA